MIFFILFCFELFHKIYSFSRNFKNYILFFQKTIYSFSKTYFESVYSILFLTFSFFLSINNKFSEFFKDFRIIFANFIFYFLKKYSKLHIIIAFFEHFYIFCIFIF